MRLHALASTRRCAKAITLLKRNTALIRSETELELRLGLPSPLEAQAVLNQLQSDLWRPLLKHAC